MHGALFQGGGARPGSGGWPVLAPSAHRELARSTVLSRSKRSRTGDRNAPAAPRRRIGIAEAASARHREPSCRLRQRGRARFDGVERRWRRQAGWGSGRRSACAVVLAPTTARRRSHHSPQRKLKTACGTRGGHEDSTSHLVLADGTRLAAAADRVRRRSSSSAKQRSRHRRPASSDRQLRCLAHDAADRTAAAELAASESAAPPLCRANTALSINSSINGVIDDGPENDLYCSRCPPRPCAISSITQAVLTLASAS